MASSGSTAGALEATGVNNHQLNAEMARQYGAQKMRTDTNATMWQGYTSPTTDQWSSLTSDAQNLWNQQINQYLQTGIWPGTKNNYVSYDKDAGKYAKYSNPASAFPGFRVNPAMTGLPSSDTPEKELAGYYDWLYGAPGYYAYQSPDEVIKANPLLWATKPEGTPEDDYYDKQAYEQVSQGLANMTSAPLYGHNINTTKMASSGGR